ncbi:MAG: hypothetical protein JO223_05555 [Hyphomicrobiales bacterium]|nr:hypothetical protein [Hyphomicrobiales bacterium]MBV8440869.1 hypothetical protein [Hyphomicrobiales bacterium]
MKASAGAADAKRARRRGLNAALTGPGLEPFNPSRERGPLDARNRELLGDGRQLASALGVRPNGVIPIDDDLKLSTRAL